MKRHTSFSVALTSSGGGNQKVTGAKVVRTFRRRSTQ